MIRHAKLVFACVMTQIYITLKVGLHFLLQFFSMLSLTPLNLFENRLVVLKRGHDLLEEESISAA
jgi:hypothetical protein